MKYLKTFESWSVNETLDTVGKAVENVVNDPLPTLVTVGLMSVGVDPVTGKHILVKDGRFGMYVTDGETNATLRRGDTLEALDLVRAQELLAGRRAWEAENS